MATKFTAGTVINAGLIVVGVDADAPPATPSPAPEPSIVTEGLVFHVDAGDTSSYSGTGTTWSDLVGSNDATLVNGVGYDNGSMVFDGNDDYVTVPSTLTIGDTFTYSAWIKADSLSGRSAIFSTRNPNSGDGLWQLEVGDGRNRVGISVPGIWAYNSSDNVISTNTWHHITVVKADASTNFEVFVDGVSQGSASVSVSTSGNNNIRVIGAGVNAIYDFFDGEMSSIMMYNTALTAADIQKNIEATNPESTPAPEPAPEPAPAPAASWLVVGAYGDSNNNGYDGGAAYVYDINDLSAQPTKLIAFDGDETARFGNSSAATSDKIFIRSRSSGSVYVYDANNLTDQPTKITIETDLSSNTTNDDICVMGDKLFVSSFKSSEVRVYNVNDLSADPVILTPSASTEDDRFGWTMAVSDEKLVVSATRDDYNGILNSGAVYVYDINDLTSEPTKLRAFDGAAQDQLGSSVDFSADKIVVGASSDDDHGSASGSVYVFDANDLSAQPTKLTAFDAAQGDGFGVSVSINSDKIVVGATGDDDNGSSSGSVYVYDASDLSAQPTKLTAFDGAASDYFGVPVLIADDKIIVGAFRGDGNATDSGSVYVYDANDLSAQPTKLTAFDGAEGDSFGRSVAVG